ncbi:uncharacterized protein N7482_007142 [Penicillium canariense]|uniref:Mid2 domain-containing protein n=1 Tax=Penicillium canariense TaxID=189055 RepID=A0A9W9HYG9_9EURO|nr:uncharacterized protein N7482_007142 [Penicillium canariense]KAJ5160138.1 hypothetical protein N7482_007142 [Penicillium canariense]
MVSSSLLVLPLCLAYIPATAAWVFSWTNSSGGFLTDHGDVIQSCKVVDNPKGNIFDWDPQSGNYCIYLYNNNNCTDPSAGYTCKSWPWSNHVAGSYIHSYEVVANGTDTTSSTSNTTSTTSTSSSASTSTMTSTTQTSAVATSTSTAANTSSPATTPIAASSDNRTSKGSSLSGGAIAGIIVGVLAAAAIAGILFFFLCWRPRKKAGSSKVPEQPAPAMSELADDDEKKPASPTSVISPASLGHAQDVYHGQRLRELPGSTVASEMGPGMMRAELDGSTQWKN